MARNLDDIKKDIEYVRTVERTVVLGLGLNEIYSLFENDKTSDKVRLATSRYLKELSDIRKELEGEVKK